jgi:hypothetical protein
MQMERIHFLAAEIFFYSYDNYDDHLGGNARFDRLMPEEARLLDAALEGNIDARKLSKKLKMSEDDLIEYLQRAKNARKIVDAAGPAEGFREAVKQSIQVAVEQGMKSESDIAALVGQICYRAADLSFVLQQKGQRLEDLSQDLRRES